MTKYIAMFVAMFAVVVAARAEDFDAKAAFDSKCAICHGKDGKGETTMGKKAGCKDFTDAKVQDAITDEKALKSLKEGIKDGETVKMKPFAEKLSEDEMKAVLKYVRSLKAK